MTRSLCVIAFVSAAALFCLLVGVSRLWLEFLGTGLEGVTVAALSNLVLMGPCIHVWSKLMDWAEAYH